MASTYKISVAVTTFNRPDGAKRAIRSVLEQSYDVSEIILVEDGPESDLKVWLARLGDARLKYVAHGDNRGLSAARNTALRLSTGDYIAYLDDDDFWKPHRISAQVDLIDRLLPDERRNVAVISCGCEIRAVDDTLLFTSRPEVRGNIKEHIMRHGLKTVPSSFLFLRSALVDVGGFDEELKSSVDHDIWMSLADTGYRADYVGGFSVVTYRHRGKKSMVSNTIPRISGVERFVEKWADTYVRWFGPVEGRNYGDRYFIRVVGRLAVGKLMEGSLSDFFQCASSIFSRDSQRFYAARFLLRHVTIEVTKLFLPTRFHNMLRRAMNAGEK